MLQVIILGLALVVMIGIFGIMIYCLSFGDVLGFMKMNMEMNDDLKKYVAESRKSPPKERGESEEEGVRILREKALEKIKLNEKQRDGVIPVGQLSHGETPLVRSGRDYIPMNLSEKDKALLRMFNES